MNRKKLIPIVLVILALVGGYAGLNYKLSFKKAYIQIKRSDVSVTVQNSDGKTVGKLTSSGSLSLRSGNYRVVPSGGNINQDPINLKVADKGAYLTVDPGYSKQYLSALLPQELPAITNTITATYSQQISDFTISNGALYGYGDWYATTLVQNPPGGGSYGDTYHTVLQKVDGEWKIAIPPAIVLTAKDHPNVPTSVIDAANTQTGD